MTLQEWGDRVTKLNNTINSLKVWDEEAEYLQLQYDRLLQQRPPVAKKYKVILESKDGQQFELSTNADSVSDAVKKAFDKIEDNGWGNYLYKTKNVQILEG